MLQEHKEYERRNSGVSIGDIQNISIPYNQTSIDQWIPSMKSDSKPTPKKIEKKSSVEMIPGEIEIQWAKWLRDKQEEENRKFHERAIKAYKQLEDINEEDIHEPVNKFTKCTRGKKAWEIPDDEKQKIFRKRSL